MGAVMLALAALIRKVGPTRWAPRTGICSAGVVGGGKPARWSATWRRPAAPPHDPPRPGERSPSCPAPSIGWWRTGTAGPCGPPTTAARLA